MTSIILYLILAVLCVICYFVVSRESYLSKNSNTYTGKVERVVNDGNAVQFLISFTDEYAVERTVMSPRYIPSSRYDVGSKVKFTYRRLRIFKFEVDAVRVEDPSLVKKESYKALLYLALVLLVLIIFRIIKVFLL